MQQHAILFYSFLLLCQQLGNEESGVDSSSEIHPKETTETDTKKHKKKKKKHRHKDDKGKRKMSTSSSNYDSPLMFDANISSTPI